MTTEPTVTREGRVTLLVSSTPVRYETFAARQWSDGTTDYYHGGATCNTADGWVTLPADQLDRVTWHS